MPLDIPDTGFSSAGEFQSSAIPWVTSSVAPAAGSPVRFDFPFVTRFITVSNLGAGSLSFGFTRAGVVSTNKKFTVPANGTVSFEVRVKEIHLQGEGATPNYTLLAGLTTVNSKNMPLLTGSLPDGSAGWQGVG